MSEFNIGLTDNIKTIDSETYGSYKVRQIATVNLINARDNGTLNEVANKWYKIKDKIYTCHLPPTKIEDNGISILENFTVWLPLLSDNLDWQGEGKLPIGYTDKKISNIINTKYDRRR